MGILEQALDDSMDEAAKAHVLRVTWRNSADVLPS